MGEKSFEELIAQAAGLIPDPRRGLPHEIFLFASTLMPLVNVDLLARDAEGRTLLAWRADEFYGPGWHVPGGIIRYKETLLTRAHEVARVELGAQVEVLQPPAMVSEWIEAGRRERGHFISILFRCRLLTPPDEKLRVGPAPVSGRWEWHRGCPADIIPEHEKYRKIIDGG